MLFIEVIDCSSNFSDCISFQMGQL